MGLQTGLNGEPKKSPNAYNRSYSFSYSQTRHHHPMKNPLVEESDLFKKKQEKGISLDNGISLDAQTPPSSNGLDRSISVPADRKMEITNTSAVAKNISVAQEADKDITKGKSVVAREMPEAQPVQTVVQAPAVVPLVRVEEEKP